jgi:hypothetical protein
MGRQFTLATDHRNLVYLRASRIPKLVRWHLALSEFNFTIVHVPGKDNVVADVLSRFFKTIVVDEREVEVEDFMKTVHNSTVGHIGSARLLKMLESLDIAWPGMRKDVEDFINRCALCKKFKAQKEPIMKLDGHTLQGLAPMQLVSADTIGPLPEDEDGNCYILHIMDSFSKFNMLIPTKSTDAMSYVNGMMEWCGLFGVPQTIRTDGAQQFVANVCRDLATMLGMEHKVIVPYHPQANGDNERWNKEICEHLRMVVTDRRLKGTWSRYLPIVQRILNATFTRSLGTYPARVIFGDRLPISQPFLFRKQTDVPFQSVGNYVQQLNDDIAMIVKIIGEKFTNDLEVRQKEARDVNPNKVLSFSINEYVLVTYPTKRPTKLSSLYRGPMKVMKVIRDEIFELLDLVSLKTIKVHADRLRKFEVDLSQEEMLELAAKDVEEFVVRDISNHRYAAGKRKNRSNLEFLVSWEGYDPEYDSWEPYAAIKDLIALDKYAKEHPELNLG